MVVETDPIYHGGRARNMPTLWAIAEFWLTEATTAYREGGESAVPVWLMDLLIDPGEPCCFKCGERFITDADWFVSDAAMRERWRKAALQRGHLQDVQWGGSDEVSNLVPICLACHRSMPPCPTRDAAIVWLEHRWTIEEQIGLLRKNISPEFLASLDPQTREIIQGVVQ